MSHHYIHFDDVHYRYPDGREALCGVSIHISHGEKVALMGANGAGKSTLLMALDGFLPPSAGTITVGDIPVCRKTLPLIRQSVGFVFQNPDDQLFMPTVWEDVAFGPANMRLPEAEIARRVEEALDAVGASQLRDSAPYRLSGGQKRSVAIATVLAMEPSVLVMDEPTSALDPCAREAVLQLIGGFSHTCIIATHDRDLALRLCPRTVVMCDGRVVADGDTLGVLSDEALLTEYRLSPMRQCR